MTRIIALEEYFSLKINMAIQEKEEMICILVIIFQLKSDKHI
jgi:hypothetical protein